MGRSVGLAVLAGPAGLRPRHGLRRGPAARLGRRRLLGRSGARPGLGAGVGPAWLWAPASAAAAGLTRPVGVLLAVPVAIEAGRRWRRPAGAERALAWRRGAGGRGRGLPGLVGRRLRRRPAPAARPDPGRPPRWPVGPLSTLAHDVAGVAHHHVGTALHVPWVVLVVALVVVGWWRLPASYGAFATRRPRRRPHRHETSTRSSGTRSGRSRWSWRPRRSPPGGGSSVPSWCSRRPVWPVTALLAFLNLSVP